LRQALPGQALERIPHEPLRDRIVGEKHAAHQNPSLAASDLKHRPRGLLSFRRAASI